jgi:hypothetical protein
MTGVDFSNSELQGVLLGDTRFDLSVIRYVASPSQEHTPLRIAKPMSNEGNSSVEGQIAAYFRYTDVSAGPEGGPEKVSAGFDSESLNKFRKSVMASLIPAGIIARDFEATYKTAAEMKWSDVAAIAVKAGRNGPTGSKDYLVKPACDDKAGSLVTPSLIRSERITFTGPAAALDVIRAFNCFGIQSFSNEFKEHIFKIENELNKMVSAARSKSDGAGGSKSDVEGAAKPAAISSPDPTGSQTVGVR